MSAKTISSEVKKLRKNSGLKAVDFAKKHGISYTVLKNYESGKCDYPTLLIARNYCKNFNISPLDFVSQYSISKDQNFNKEVFLESLIFKLYGDYSTHEETFEPLLDERLGLNFVKKCKLVYPTYFSIHIRSILENEKKEKIAFDYFGYNKIRNAKDVLYAYRHLVQSIQNVLLRPLKDYEYDTKVSNIKNFVFTTPSKRAFCTIYKEIAQTTFFNQSKQKKEQNCKSPVNVTIVFKPSYCSSELYYYCVVGKDFINKKEYYLKNNSKILKDTFADDDAEDPSIDWE